jgi:hypothetical protein
MFSGTIQFLRSNMNLVIAYLLISISALALSKYLVALLALILMLGVAFLGLNFFITASELIRDGSAGKSIKSTFLRFDKNIVKKILLLLLFFIAIYIIFHILMVIYSMTPLKIKFAPVLAEHTFIPAVWGLMGIALTVFFKMVLLTSAATIIYFRNGIIDSIKSGFKTIFRLRSLLLIILLMFVLDALVPRLIESRAVIVYSKKISYFLITPFIFLMSFYYYKGLEGNSSTNDIKA